MPKKTVAETVNYAVAHLVNSNRQSSLVMLKKYLVSDCGEAYVSRNYDRVKTELKAMFERKDIRPAKQSIKKPSVTTAFTLATVKKSSRRVSVVKNKMVQKKAKAKATNKKKQND